MPGVTARMKCSEVKKTESYEQVTLNAVYSSNRGDPNYTWSAATPNGKLELTVSNKDVWGYSVPGQTYQLDFHKVS